MGMKSKKLQTVQHRLRIFLASITTALILTMVPCDSLLGAAPGTIDYSKAAKLLNEIEKGVEEWGYASISELLLIEDVPTSNTPREHGRFNLNYEQDTGFYMDRARTNLQGAAALERASAFETQVEARATNNEIQRLMDEREVLLQQIEIRKLQQQLEGLDTQNGTISTNTTNSIPISNSTASGTNNAATLSTTNAPLPLPQINNSTNTAASVLSSNQFTPFQGLLSDLDNLRPSEGDVLKIGSSHKVTELLLNYMSNPVDLPENKVAFLGLSQIAVSPGWRTREGYVCEIRASVQYATTKKTLKNRIENNYSAHADKPLLLQGEEEQNRWKYSNLDKYFRSGDWRDFPQFPGAREWVVTKLSPKLHPFDLKFMTNVGSVKDIPGKGKSSVIAAQIKDTWHFRIFDSQREIVPNVPQKGINMDRFAVLQRKLNATATNLSKAGVTSLSEGDKQDLLNKITAVISPTEFFEYQDNYVSDFIDKPTEDPRIFSVFPFAEAQALDLKSSTRRQLALLLSLAATFRDAGLQADAKTINSFVKRIQQDVRTHSYLPVVVPSSNGSAVTYRFEPSMTALADPASSKTKPGYVLNATSIPVLTVIVCNKNDLQNWSHVRLDINTRWFPIEKRHWFKRGLVDWWLHGHVKGARLTGDERLKQVRQLETLWYELSEMPRASDVASEISRRWINLERIAQGFEAVTALPHQLPVIQQLIPATVPKVEPPAEFKIIGENFESNGSNSIQHALLGGESLELVEVESNVVNAKLGNAGQTNGLRTGQHDLVLLTRGGRRVIAQNAIEVTGFPPPELSKVFPATLNRNSPMTLHFIGNHFNRGNYSGLLHAYLGTKKLEIQDSTVKPTYFTATLESTTASSLPIGRHNVSVVSQSGVATLSNAVEVVTQRTPSIDTISPTRAAVPQKLNTNVIQKSFTILGSGFLGSTNQFVVSLGNVIASDFKVKNEHVLTATFNIALLTTNRYDLNIRTEFGSASKANAFTITEKPSSKPIPKPTLAAVYPERGYVYQETLFILEGTGLQVNGKSVVEKVTVGGRLCESEVLNPTNLVVIVPKWAESGKHGQFGSSSNRAHVVVATKGGIAHLPKSVYFDLALPDDTGTVTDSAQIGAEHERLRKILDNYMQAKKLFPESGESKASMNLNIDAGTPSSTQRSEDNQIRIIVETPKSPKSE